MPPPDAATAPPVQVRPRGAGADAPWTFPAAANGGGESMRATAERALAEGLQLEGVQVGAARQGAEPGKGVRVCAWCGGGDWEHGLMQRDGVRQRWVHPGCWAAEEFCCFFWFRLPFALVQTFFVGNAPMGHHAAGGGSGSGSGGAAKAVAAAAGNTLFFHRCQLIQGVPALQAGGPWGDHAWVAKDELGDYIKDAQLLELLQKML